MSRKLLTRVVLLVFALVLLPPHAAAETAPPPVPWLPATQVGALRVRVAQPGLQTIPFAVLVAAGWDATTDFSRVALWYHGSEQPLTVTADQAIQFVARPLWSRYHADSVYWLTRESRAGLRGAPVLAPGLPVSWDADARYESRVATPAGDHWFAAELAADDSQRASVQLALAAPTALPDRTRMQLALASVLAGPHQLQIQVNTQQFLLSWTGAGAYLGTLSLAALPAGPIAITIQALTPGDVVLFDQVGLPDVQPAFRDQAATPTVTPGFGPAETSVRGASVLLLTHADFRAALGPLVQVYAQRAERAAIVDVQAIYDRFSFGERDPEALRSFIRSLSPSPRVVLLIGAGSVRLRPQPEQTDPVFIPPYLVMADPLRGEIACDTCYTRLDTASVLDDVLPDLPIGRFPVRTLAEAQTLVAKTVTALTAPPGGPWQARAALLTDNDYQVDGTPDPAGSFVDTAETVISALPRGIQATRLYYAPDRAAAGPYEPNAARLRCRLFRLLDGGAKSDTACAPNAPTDAPGVALWVYVGHGSPWQWGATSPQDAVPYLFYLYDADGRKNGDRLPILLSMTCLSGDWANPTLQTTDERLLLRVGGGTVASLSATGQGVNTGHTRMLTGLLPRLTATTGDRTLGAAHLAGLAMLGGQYRDLAFSFGILGDPDVQLPFVPKQQTYLPFTAH